LRLRVTVHAHEATYSLRDTGTLELIHHGQPVMVRGGGHPTVCPIPAMRPLTETPKQPPGRVPVRRFNP
jgi:hypothetical protein